MLTPSILILLASAGLIEAASVLDARHHHLHRRAANGGGDSSATTLAANAIQTGSFVDGSKQVGANEANQAKSQTSQNNFINFCAGKTLSNGLQITTGSCNGIPMGDLPAKTKMVSSIILFPEAGSANIQSDTTFNISVQMSNLVAGSFTNADATYFSAPQFLSGGQVVGHTHVTVQDMGSSLNPTTPLNPTQFAFFKGINDAGNGNGLLQAVVTGGLPAGHYRVCTMASASNHQPVIMPVAQRGTADDCTKFTVIGNGNVENAAANDGAKGIAAAALAASAVAAGPGAIQSSAASVASSSTTAKGGNGGKATSSSAETSTAKGGKGGKATSSSAASVASSSTAKGGNGGKFTSSSVAAVKTTSASVAESSATAKGGNGGKGGKATSSAAASVESSSTAKGGNGGKFTSSSVAAVKTTSASIAESSATARGGKGGKGGKATTSSSEISTSATTSKIGNGKAVSTPLFANTTFAAATTKASNGNGKGNAVTTTSLAASSVSLASTKAGKGGKGNAVSTAAGSIQTTIVQKVVVIETFFEFVLSLGGLPPSVGKKGNSFVVLEEIFEDIVSAAGAACTAQYNRCISFSGPGFSFEECSSQKESCGSAASTQTSAAAPATVTATAIVPPSATVTGSVIAEATITTSIAATASQVVANVQSVAPAQTTAAAVLGASSQSTCALVTNTVWVDAPSSTLAVAAVATSSSIASSSVIASSTSSAASKATASPVSNATALGGIAAPAITDSGDSTRPFEVNGNTFVNKSAAAQRACDIQFNACANAFNSGAAAGAFNMADCTTQQQKCISAGGS